VSSPPEFENTLDRFGAGTPNARRVAAAMDTIGRGSNIAKLYNVLANMSANDPQGLADAFAQLHGEVFASNKEAAAHLQQRFLRLLPSAQSRLMCNEQCEGEWNRWANILGDWRQHEGIGLYSGYDLSTAGVAVGFDRHVKRNMLLGGAFGYDYVHQDFNSIQSQDKMEVFRTMFYGGWWSGRCFANSYAGYTRNNHRTQRNISIDNAFNATARSKYGDDMFSTGFEIGREFCFGITPSVSMHYIYLGSPSVTETGGGEANLHVHSGSYESLRVPMGVKWNRSITGSQGVVWTPEVRAFYIRELADDTARVRTSFDGVRGVSFLADGGKWGRSSSRLGIGLNTQVLDWVDVRMDYDCDIYDHGTTNAFAATLRMYW
jgi:outer membrane autotransporter protein